MPAPFVTGVGASASGVGAVTPGLPPEVWDRDTLLMFCESQDTTAVPAVAGWPDVTGSPVFASTGTATRLTCRWTYGFGGMAAPTVPDAGDHLLAVIVGVRGAALQGNPWNITAAATDLTATTAVSIPGATTTLPECLVVAAVSTGTDANSAAGISGWTNASLTGLAEVFDTWVIAGGGGGLGIAAGVKSTAGAYSATTATLATANFKACLSIALRPAQMLAIPVPTKAGPVG